MTQLMAISIEEELKKNSELKKSDIDDLREWCKKQPHLPEILDSELIIFLHSNYYHIEPTKTTIDSFYTIKTHVPELFADRDILNNQGLHHPLNITAAIPLQQLTKEGYHIILLRIMNPDASKYVFSNNLKLILMALELWLWSSGTIKGHILLFDVQNITMGHVTRMNPTGVKKFLRFLQDGLPVRMKGLYFMNANPAVNLVLNMAKPFMKKELTEMLQVHTVLENMNKIIPIEALPDELGGKAGPIKELHEAEIQKIKAHRDWFLEEQLRARVDESKRPKQVKSNTKCPDVKGKSHKFELD